MLHLLAALLLTATPTDTPASLLLDRWLIVDVAFGDRTAPFLVDTGANRTLVDTAFVRSLGVEPERCIDIPGAMVGQICRGVLPTFSFAGRTFTGIDAFVSDMTTSDLGQALNVAGLIGADVLSQGVLVIDYPAARWRFVPRESFAAPATAQRLTTTMDGGMLRVAATLNGKPARLLLDTGNAGEIIVLGLDGEAMLQPAAQALTLPAGLKSGAGGGADIAPGRATVRVGPFTWTAAPVQVARAGTRSGTVMSSEDGIVGAGFLRHFRVSVDMGANAMWLEQVLPFGTLDASGLLGLIVRPRGGKLVVDAVARSGPAHAAGLAVGDVIVRLNGVDVNDHGPVLWPLLMAPDAGDTVALDVERAGKTRSLKLRAVPRP